MDDYDYGKDARDAINNKKYSVYVADFKSCLVYIYNESFLDMKKLKDNIERAQTDFPNYRMYFLLNHSVKIATAWHDYTGKCAQDYYKLCMEQNMHDVLDK